tara:strand:+ start:1170 stop:2114 length:945 start_codon:yes stop_codon:yes gene_type:complete
MGINTNQLKFLLYAKSNGADFTRTITIGRQGLNFKKLKRNIQPGRYVKKWFKRFDLKITDKDAHKLERISNDKGYSEFLFKLLGAEVVHSIDVSSFEGANIIHDMNCNISDELTEEYTAVFDGGCLEHIFNFPIAIRNCMCLLNISGSFLSSTPINNYVGHGFYQFTPELFFRLFSIENGFKTVSTHAYINRYESQWYSIADPLSVGTRVKFVNAYATDMFFHAVKTRKTNILSVPPQQSDYKHLWEKYDKTGIMLEKTKYIKSEKENFLRRIYNFLPTELKRIAWVLRQRKQALDYHDLGDANPDHFRKINCC